MLEVTQGRAPFLTLNGAGALNLGGPVPAYPDRAERNPKKKTAAWIAQFGRAFVSEVLRNNDYRHWYGAAALNQTRLLYLFGKQDPQQYNRFVDEATRANDPTGISQRIDRRILPLVPKLVRILSDKLEEQEFAPTVTVVDELGEEEKQQHLDLIRLWQRQGEALEQMGIQPPGELPAELPRDEEDLSLYAAAEYQHELAMVMEQKMAMCLAEANWKQSDREVVMHFYATGDACGYLSTGPGGRPQPGLLLPGRCLFAPSAHEDYRDMRAGAHIEYLTLGQLRGEAGDQLSEDDYKLIAERGSTKPDGELWMAGGVTGNPADSGIVTVVRVSFLSEDDLVYKTRTDKYGNSQTRRKSTDYKNAQGDGAVTRATASNVYEVTLVVGTDCCYNSRLAVAQLRDIDNPLLGRLPYVPFTPGLLNGESSCPMDEVMPIADFCQEQWLRLQEACLRAVPQGYNFDVDVLIESALQLKGKAGISDAGFELKPTLDMFYRTGNTVSSRRDKRNPNSILPPAVTKNDTGVPTDVVQYWQNLRAGIQMLESIMSSNAVVSAATPNPETGKGVAELAVQGTMSSLGYLAHGKRAIFEGICRAMGLRIWLQERKRPVTGTLPAQGGQPPQRVAPAPKLAERRFNFRIERKPTKEDWARFYANMQRALDTEQITPADYAFLEEVDNLKMARRILVQRGKRNKEQLLQQAQQNQQATFDGQIRTAQEAEKAKQVTLTLEYDRKDKHQQLVNQGNAEVAMIYVQGQQQNEQARAQAQEAKTQAQQEGETFRTGLREQARQDATAQAGASAGYADLQPAA